MDTFELNNLDLVEFKNSELKDVNGGFYFTMMALVGVGNAIGYGAFMAGWDAARNTQ